MSLSEWRHTFNRWRTNGWIESRQMSGRVGCNLSFCCIITQAPARFTKIVPPHLSHFHLGLLYICRFFQFIHRFEFSCPPTSFYLVTAISTTSSRLETFLFIDTLWYVLLQKLQIIWINFEIPLSFKSKVMYSRCIKILLQALLSYT